MANQVIVTGQMAGQATDEGIPLTLIRVDLGDGTIVGAVPIQLTGGVTFDMLDDSLKGTARYDISVYDAIARYQ